jgi:hypothetical protein
VMSSFRTVRDLQLQFEIHLAPPQRVSPIWLSAALPESASTGRLAAKAANALRLCRFLAISVGDARGA